MVGFGLRAPLHFSSFSCSLSHLQMVSISSRAPLRFSFLFHSLHRPQMVGFSLHAQSHFSSCSYSLSRLRMVSISSRAPSRFSFLFHSLRRQWMRGGDNRKEGNHNGRGIRVTIVREMLMTAGQLPNLRILPGRRVRLEYIPHLPSG